MSGSIRAPAVEEADAGAADIGAAEVGAALWQRYATTGCHASQ